MLLVVAVLVLASIGIMLFVRYQFGKVDSGGSGEESATRTQPVRPLAETGEAEFMTVFVYGEDGEMAAYMVGGQTQEFDSIRGAVASATDTARQADESFSDLLVFSFPDGTTMEVAYSPASNSLSYGGNVFQLTEELNPYINTVVERFNS